MKLEKLLRELKKEQIVKMPMCWFCKKNYEFPKGISVVGKDGNVKFYCSSKCRKNSEMGRNNRKVNWVRKSDQMKEIRAKLDSQKKK